MIAPTGALLLSAQDLSPLIGMSPDWIREQARRGKLPAHRLGRSWRFNPEEVIEATKPNDNPWALTEKSKQSFTTRTGKWSRYKETAH